MFPGLPVRRIDTKLVHSGEDLLDGLVVLHVVGRGSIVKVRKGGSSYQTLHRLNRPLASDGSDGNWKTHLARIACRGSGAARFDWPASVDNDSGNACWIGGGGSSLGRQEFSWLLVRSGH